MPSALRRHSLRRHAPLLAVLLAPFLVRLPFWALGVSLSPFWVAAQLNEAGRPFILAGLPGFIDIETGWTTQALGIQAARQWLSGQIPWWDPFSGVGLPLAAEMQSSALFLPYILLTALPGGTVLMLVALQVTGGVSALLLGRRLGLSPLAATTGALLFELGGTFAWIGAPCGLPNAFLPMFLLGLERARAAALAPTPAPGDGRRLQGYRTITAAVALSLYAGFPEVAYMNGLLALAWAALRLATLPGPALGPMRRAYAWRVAAGGTAGLLLAAPILVTFAHLLTQSTLGSRTMLDMGTIVPIAPSEAMYVLPYVLGPIAGFSGLDPGGLMVDIWGRAGGYLGVPLAIGALMGVAAGGGRERALRIMLFVWILACFGRIHHVPGLWNVWQLVPEIGQIQFFRYSGATWMLAASLLTAFALDARRVHVPRAAWLWPALASAALGLVVAWSLSRGWSIVEALLAGTRAYRPILAGSIVWAAATALAATILWGIRRPGRPLALAALLLIDAAAMFMAPFASGHSGSRMDQALVSFLQANLGLQRFYTLGPFQPNYAGVFGIASINHNYLPVPRWWPDYVRDNLDPNAHDILFIGDFPAVPPGQPNHFDAVSTNLRSFAGLGVKYVLTGGENGVGLDATALAPPGPDTPRDFKPGERLTLTLPNTRPGAGIQAVQLRLGTYRGAARGPLEATLCAGTLCGRGTLTLEGARDNGFSTIHLAPSLPAGDAPLTLTLNHPGGTPVAIYTAPSPGRDTTLGAASLPDTAPRATLVHALAANGLRTVLNTGTATVLEVENPSPYWEPADPACTLGPATRETVRATCPGPTTLLRRELWFPGWSATVNGAPAILERDGPLFTRIALPAGAADIRFRYVPPYAAAFTALFAGGLLALLPWRRRRA